MASGAVRSRSYLLSAGLVILALLSAAPARAQQPEQPPKPEPAGQQEPSEARVLSQELKGGFVRSPDNVFNPIPQTVEIPPKRQLPAFFRDTDIKLHLRTFYFNRENDDNTASEALATGGWLQFQSGWLLDTFAIGGTYFTSLPLYAPADRPGSLLLTPKQRAIGVFGEAWAALRYEEYALLKGGRERIDEGYVNPQDNRMVPNTFEALMLSGKFGWARYDIGYIWNIKPRDSNDFISMSRQAGAPGDNQGLLLTALGLTPIKDLSLYGANYYVHDVFNTAFGKAEYTYHISEDLALQFGVQYTNQRSVGAQQLGDFSTWDVGVGARVLWKGLAVGVAMHRTGDGDSIRSPYGTWPGYLSLLVTDFDRAGEQAYGIGVRYDFGGALLPFQVQGLNLYMIFAAGIDRIDPGTGAGQPNTYEGDLDIIYNLRAVKGLSLRFRNGYAGRGKGEVVKDFRIIINYELDLL